MDSLLGVRIPYSFFVARLRDDLTLSKVHGGLYRCTKRQRILTRLARARDRRSTPSQTGTADVAPSNDPAGAEGQAARAASDCTLKPRQQAPSSMMPSPIQMRQNRRPIMTRLTQNPGARNQYPRRPARPTLRHRMTRSVPRAKLRAPHPTTSKPLRQAPSTMMPSGTQIRQNGQQILIPSRGEPGTAESTPSQTGTADVAPSNDPAGAEGQVARAASDSPEATATCLVKHDASGNPDMPEQAIDLNLSPSELGTAGPTIARGRHVRR